MSADRPGIDPLRGVSSNIFILHSYVYLMEESENSLGTKYTYKLQKQQGSRPRIGGPVNWRTIATSGSLTAFNPYRSAISCGF